LDEKGALMEPTSLERDAPSFDEVVPGTVSAADRRGDA
jgi:hypothetical protein